MKRKIVVLLVLIGIIAIAAIVYPHIEFQSGGKLIALRYSDDISEFEDDISLDERYTYYADKDLTITGFDFKKFLCFYVLLMDCEEGNLIESQYILEEAYMEDFLKNAVIEENTHNLNLAALIKDKKAIVSNTRYVPEDYASAASIYYRLHDEDQVMFVYEAEELLVIQVGYPDEGPKYIAYQ